MNATTSSQQQAAGGGSGGSLSSPRRIVQLPCCHTARSDAELARQLLDGSPQLLSRETLQRGRRRRQAEAAAVVVTRCLLSRHRRGCCPVSPFAHLA